MPAAVSFEKEAELIAAEAARAKRQALPAVVSPPVVTLEQIELITRTVAPGATPDELKLFLFDNERQGVHPLDKLIHFTVRKQRDGSRKYTPITSIDFMRIRAAETGEYAGSDDAVFAEDGHTVPTRATVTVWRLVGGVRCPFTASARWSEYKPDQEDFMWRKMPHTMLAKCAESLALRKGFPRQLAGLYAKEELDQAGPLVDASPVAPPTPQVSAAPADMEEREARLAATGENRGTPDTIGIYPPGYVLIDAYQFKNGWHDVTVGQTRYSTKTAVGRIAGEAFEGRVPVKIVSVPKPGNSKGEHWLNGVEVFRPASPGPDTDEPVPF